MQDVPNLHTIIIHQSYGVQRVQSFNRYRNLSVISVVNFNDHEYGIQY